MSSLLGCKYRRQLHDLLVQHLVDVATNIFHRSIISFSELFIPRTLFHTWSSQLSNG